MNRDLMLERLVHLARAAPGAFKADPVFRYAALGAGLALIMLVLRLGGHSGGLGAPPPPPGPPARLGARYGDPTTAPQAPTRPTPLATAEAPIAPSRSLQGVSVTQDPSAPPDRFGTLTAVQPTRRPKP